MQVSWNVGAKIAPDLFNLFQRGRANNTGRIDAVV